MEFILELDKDLFFFLNGLHATWLDPVMVYISKTWTWIPVWIIFLWILIKEYGWYTLIWLLGIAIAVTIADQFTSGFMKPFFERYRPSRDPSIDAGLVHLVNGYKGGTYGFASSHAANAFAVATFLFILLRGRIRFAGLLFLIAGIIAYSRIYLGVHYPGDIIVGGVVGAAAGWFALLISKRIYTHYQRRERIR